MPDLQEWLALGLVAGCVAALIAHRRRRPAGRCGDCASAGNESPEQVVRFYRRVGPTSPPADATPRQSPEGPTPP